MLRTLATLRESGVNLLLEKLVVKIMISQVDRGRKSRDLRLVHTKSEPKKETLKKADSRQTRCFQEGPRVKHIRDTYLASHPPNCLLH